MPDYNEYSDDNDDDKSEQDQLENGVYRNKIISNDTTGEKIYVSFFYPPKYFYIRDSAMPDKNNKVFIAGDSSWIIRSRKKSELPNHMKVFETVVSDTGSSRTLWTKSYYKDGINFSILPNPIHSANQVHLLKAFLKASDPQIR